MPAEKLFRYLSPHNRSIFRDKRMWFSAIRDFNDIFEMLPNLTHVFDSQIEEALKRNFAFDFSPNAAGWSDYKLRRKPFNQALKRATVERSLEILQNQISERFGVICFCENGDHPLMWGHYTACHRGFAVEFFPEHEIFSTKVFGKVQYSETRPTFDPKNTAPILLTKSKEWDYEVEHRLIQPLDRLPFAEREKGVQRPYMNLPMGAVKAVYLGCRIELKTERELRESLNTPEGKHIKIYMMRRHHSKYRLVAIPWEDEGLSDENIWDLLEG